MLKVRARLLATVSLAAGIGLAGAASAQVVTYPDGSTNAAPIVLTTDTVQLQVSTGSATQAGVISEASGSHGFEKIGAGNLTLTAANTYSGVTRLTAGGLTIGDGGTNGSVVGDIVAAAGSQVVFNRSDDFTYGGDLRALNAAGIEKRSAGTLTVTGEIRAGLGFVVTEGTLRIGDGGDSGTVRDGRVDVAAGAHVIADHSVSYAQITGVTGAGSFTKNGSGSLTVTDVIDNTGGVTVNAGVLRIGSLLGSFGRLNTNATVAAGAVVAFIGDSESHNPTYAYGLSGAGVLRKEYTNTLFLTGANTNTGGLDIQFGSVQVGVGGTTGSITGPVVLGGNSVTTLAFNRSDTVQYSGDISGHGVLRQLGSGMLVLTGAATNARGAWVTAGALSIGAGGTSGSIAGDIINDAAVVFNRSDATAYGGRMSGTGSLTKQGGGALILTGTNTHSGGTTVSAGTLRIGNGGTTGSITGNVINNANLAFNRSDAVTYQGVISGTGNLFKEGAGSLTLTGMNLYSGATTVSAGRLNVTGSISGSAVTVASGATLAGTGTVGSTSIAAGGVLGSTGPTGVLTIAGGLNFASGSTYAVDVTPASASRVNVTGAASLNGGVTAAYASGDYIAKHYTILSAQGGLTGSFSSLANTNLPAGFRSSLSYDANNAYIDLEILLPTYSDLNQNQAGVANAIADYFDRTGGINPIYAVLTADQLNVVAGETGMLNVTTGARVASELLSAFSDHVSDASADNGWRLWGRAEGSRSTFEANGAVGYSGSEITHQQVLFGADRTLTSDLVVGVAYAAGTADFEDQRGGRGDADFGNLGLYGRLNGGKAYIGFGAAVGSMDSVVTRTVQTDVTDVLRSTIESDMIGARLEVGFGMRFASFGAHPYLAAQVTRVDVPGYSEAAISGDDTYALTYAAQELEFRRFELGSRFETGLGQATARSTRLTFSLAGVYDETDPALTASFSALPGSAFASHGVVADGASLLVGAGVSARVGAGLFLSGSVRGQFGSFDSSGAEIALRYAW